jgi:acyl-CoA synthetase (NDP forming)
VGARDLTRLLTPRSIAVIGGGTWAGNVISECRKIGFSGPLYAVHPSRDEVAGVRAVPSVNDLPEAVDAAFVGVNRRATVDVVRDLAARGAGGAVCFASGFLEADAETGDGADLQAALLSAAGDMPILGPNCYGFINYLDGAALWPDQHGGRPVDRGVAILTQSSNIAINLSMQRRGLPLAYLVTLGNQAQTGLSEVAQALLTDPRVTALGLHIEGIDDLRGFEVLAQAAYDAGKAIVALKVGASEQAQAATISHTASLAGSAAGATALLRRLGIAQVGSLDTMLEALKILHVAGPLPHAGIISASCSGGEASLMADSGATAGVTYPPLSEAQQTGLRAALGPHVALANPLDYHTYIWGDEAAMQACFGAMMTPDVALGVLVLDLPRADRCAPDDWMPTVRALCAARAAQSRPMAVLTSLPEGLPEEVSQDLLAADIVPMHGMDPALQAIAAVADMRTPDPQPLLLPHGDVGQGVVMHEADAKAALAQYGLFVPRRLEVTRDQLAQAAQELGYPLVLKTAGLAHKSEAGGVALNLTTVEAVEQAAQAMGGQAFLLEQMVTGAVAELLIGVTCDAAHGYVLTLAAGGVTTELLQDSTQLLIPAARADVATALDRLKIAPLLHGFRGKPAADLNRILDAVMAVQDYVIAKRPSEIDINPLICTPHMAVAADALIKTGGHDDRSDS